MKKSLFCLLLIASFVTLFAQNRAPNEGQVYYYKQTGVVRNNKKTAGDNTGQFISFTHAGCYDSNNQRYDIGNGFLAYKGLNAENTIHTYYGKSYWGENSSYFFFNNFNSLNIHAPDGVIYVYEKTTAPAGVVTCAKIYVKPEQPKQSTAVVDSYPVSPGSVITVTPPGTVVQEQTRPSYDVAYNQRRYDDLKRKKHDQEQYLIRLSEPVDRSVAEGHFRLINETRALIREYERQMSDIQNEARRYGYSIY